MKFLSALLPVTVLASTLPPSSSPPLTCLTNPLPPSLLSHLASRLSPNATLLLPSSPLFQTAHLRWQAFSPPTYSLVVEVATEEDVAATVRFANKHSLPFLAVNGAHGTTSALGKMKHGIAISFVRMKTVEPLPGGKLARLGPGLTNGELVRGLWGLGKMTSTGRCMCPGITGIALGGGHGDLQGLWGRPGDQIVEMRVVLADGRVVELGDGKGDADLWWAMRGAGHNFGVVTGMTWRVYERVERWSKIALVFPAAALEGVFEVGNGLLREGAQPGGLTVYYIFVKGAEGGMDVLVDFTFGGELAELEAFAAPFRKLGPVGDTSYDGKTYAEINALAGNDEASPGCGKGYHHQMTGAYTKRHNVTAMRRVHNLFTDILTKYPGLGDLSVFFVEGYAQQGMLKVPADSTAGPFRAYPLLSLPLFTYTNPAWSDDVIATVKEIKRVMTESDGPGEPPRGYVNYAFGDEESEELFGYEKWRMEKLRRLKRKYDPEGKFSFYAPIDGSLGG